MPAVRDSGYLSHDFSIRFSMYVIFFLLLQIKIDEEAQEYSDFDFNFNVLIFKREF